jgi:hypothetical protein
MIAPMGRCRKGRQGAARKQNRDGGAESPAASSPHGGPGEIPPMLLYVNGAPADQGSAHAVRYLCEGAAPMSSTRESFEIRKLFGSPPDVPRQ